MKKKLSVTLSLILLTAIFLGSVTTLAQTRATTPSITVSDMHASAGDEVKVAVSISGNPGIIGMTLALTYDESVMTLTNVERGAALSEMTFTMPKNLKSGCNFPWDAEFVSPEQVTNGDILLLTFKIAANAADGSYSVKLSYDPGAIIDNDVNPVSPQIKNGTISVGSTSFLKGDFDFDGELTVADALAALRIAAKFKAPTAEDFKIGDMDGDGEITVADALNILRTAAKLI